MHISAYGLPAGIGVILIGIAAILRHHHKHLHRAFHGTSMVAFGIGAFFLALGVLPWQRALATLTGTGTGLVVLLLLGFALAAALWYEVKHQHEHKRARAHAYAVTFGTTLVMLIGNGARLLSEAARSPAATGRALQASVRVIGSAHASHAMNPRHALEIVGLGAVALVALLTVAGRKGAEKKKGRGRGDSGPRAITSGRPAIPAGTSTSAIQVPGRKGS